MLDKHWMLWALALALLSAGSSIAAKMAMIAMTTSSSMSVNPAPLGRDPGAILVFMLSLHVY